MTLPSIPDNIYKLFLLAGIFCLGFAYFEDNRNGDVYFSKVNTFNSSIDSLDIELLKVDHQKDRLKEISDILSKKNNIKNPITTTDSTIYFNQILSGDKMQVLVSDSLSSLWQEFKENQFKIDIYNKQLKIKKDGLKDAEDEFKSSNDANKWPQWLGGIFLILGLIGMTKIQDTQDELLKRQLSDKPKTYNYCQSCGKKFSAIRHISKNSDGTINPAFCTSCYVDGHFIESELTKEEFLKRAAIEAKKRKTWLGRKLISNRLKNLERWDSDDYF